MPRDPLEVIELTEQLLSAAFCRMSLLSRLRTREISEDLGRNLDTLADDIAASSNRLLELAKTPNVDPAVRALLLSMVAALRDIGTQPLSSRSSSAAYTSTRQRVLSLAHLLGQPAPRLPLTLNGLLVLHPLSGKLPRVMSQPPGSSGEDILHSYRQGESLSSIGRRHGVSRQAIHQYLKRRGAI